MRNEEKSPHCTSAWSRDDELTGESNSTSNQKQMLEDFAFAEMESPNPTHFYR